MSVLTSTCGCTTITGNWQPETLALIDALQIPMGLLPLVVGNTLDAIVLLAKSGVPGTSTRLLIYKVGNPDQEVNTDQGYQAEVGNGENLILPADVKILEVKVNTSLLEPIDSDYVLSGSNLALIRDVRDANVYITVTNLAERENKVWIVSVGTPDEEPTPGYNNTVANGDPIEIPAGYDVLSVQVNTSVREPIAGDYDIAAGLLTFGTAVEDANVYLLLKKQ